MCLSNIEQAALMRIAGTTQNVKSVQDLKEWIPRVVAPFFPHEMLICGAGSVSGIDVKIERVLGVGYPDGFMAHLGTMTDLVERSVLRRWLAENKPQLIDETMVETALSGLEQSEVRTLGLVNIAAYGVLDLTIGRGTYFSFSRIPGPITRRHGKLLEMVVPYLHHALLRVAPSVPRSVSIADQPLALLTPKEREILIHIAAGLTNREIAHKVFRSELTIQTHVHSLLKKLNVSNRAAAIALLRGFVSNDRGANSDVS